MQSDEFVVLTCGQRPYSDEEGSLTGKVVNDNLETQVEADQLTYGHPTFAERGIRTFEDKLLKRGEADENKEKSIQWTDYIVEGNSHYRPRRISLLLWERHPKR